MSNNNDDFKEWFNYNWNKYGGLIPIATVADLLNLQRSNIYRELKKYHIEILKHHQNDKRSWLAYKDYDYLKTKKELIKNKK